MLGNAPKKCNERNYFKPFSERRRAKKVIQGKVSRNKFASLLLASSPLILFC